MNLLAGNVFKAVSKVSRRLGLVVLGSFMAVTGVVGILVPAYADVPRSPDAPPADANAAALTEIVVTAQKRSQSINDVGMSITAVNDATLRDLGIRSVADLTKIEPSFIVFQNEYGAPIYQIRGVAYNEHTLSASPAVSVYVDEVPYAYPALTKGATLDLQRVEILKGPQGTLFGQNATGGAINYIAAKPTATPEYGYELTYARFGAINSNGFASGPLTDTLGARVSFNLDQGGAWQRSVTRDATLGDKDNFQGRLLLDWNPTSALHFGLNVNGWTDRSDTMAAQLEKSTPQSPQVVGALAGNPVVQQQLINIINGLNSYPVVLNNDRDADWNTGSTPRNDQAFYQIALRSEYALSDSTHLTSITSYEHYTQNDFIDNDGLNTDDNNETDRGLVQSFSQEFRINAQLLDDRLNALGGVTYSRDRSTENNIGGLPDSTPAYALTAVGIPEPFASIGIYGDTKSVTKAVFSDLDFKVLPTLSVHAGARYTQSDIDYRGCLYNTDSFFADGTDVIQALVKGAANVIPIPLGACETLSAAFNPQLYVSSLDQNNVSWRSGIDWHFTPDQLLYFSASKGFKSGSFPVAPQPSAVQFHPVTQESVLAYEIGYKGELLDRTLVVTAAAFHYNYLNKQLEGRILDPTGVFGVINALVNVPKSTEDGFEMSTTWRPFGGLSFNFSGTYLDARVTGAFFTYDPFYGDAPKNFDGYRFPDTPRWVGSVGSRYEWTIANNRKAFIGTDYRYQSGTESAFVSTSDYEPGATYIPGFPYSAGSLAIAPYGVLDMRAGINSANDHWRLELWGKNVTNKYYWTQSQHVYDTTVRFPGMPATFGVTVGYRFAGG